MSAYRGGRMKVLAFAWKEQRILLTHDFDFLDDSRFPFQRNPGLVGLLGGMGSTLGLAEPINGVLPVRTRGRFQRVVGR